MKSLAEQLNESATFLKSQINFDWENSIYMILGSGFKAIVDEIDPIKVIPLNEIPNVLTPKVEGHGTDLLFCEMNGTPVIFQTGRIHLYEGHDVFDLVYTTRLAATMGVKHLILSNASGSLSKDIVPGTLLVMTDHINLMGVNALSGRGSELGKTFVDMYNCYDPQVIETLKETFNLPSGVYVGLSGPTFETAAETKMLSILGADLVGMSTVQECIAARQLGLKVTGLSLATNFAAGIASEVDHDAVLEIGAKAAPMVRKILPEIINIISKIKI